MKRLLLIAALCVSFQSVFSQNLLTSRRSGHVTIIYKLTDAEALKLINKRPYKLPETIYHTSVAVYQTDSGYQQTLAPGHYLHVTAKENELRCDLESIDNLNMQILNNHRDLQLVFIDNHGVEVESVRPSIGKKEITFDKTLHVYRIATTNRQGIVAVPYEGHTNFFQIGRQYNNTFGARTKRRILYTFPMRQVLAPFRYVYRSTKSLIQWGRIDPPPIYYKVRDKANDIFDGREFEGFMVLNKPKYKPGDTVKLKAFVTTKKGKPVSRELEIHLVNYSHGFGNKKVKSVKPYRPGCYATEFVLLDSLNLSLDYQYMVRLQDKRLNDYPTKDFRYEQYDLKQNNFFLRALETDLTKNKPKVIFLKGTDSNEMPLFDVNVELLALTKSVKGFYEHELFVPDTLWKHSLKLDPIGETRVALPDSIFLNAAIDINLKALFRNAENELHEKSVDLHYDAKSPEYEAKLDVDSVHFSSNTIGEVVTWVVLNHEVDDVVQKTVTLPYSERVNQNVSEYQIVRDKQLLKSIELEDEASLLEVMANRMRDSLHIGIQNPRKILFRYQLFRNNSIVKRGSGTAWSIKMATEASDRYYLSVQFVWAGKAEEQNFDLPFAKKALQLDVTHEPVVYPGQTTDINIQLKDAFGEPVRNADITAHAWAKKFNASPSVELKQYEKSKDRKAFNVFHTKEIEDIETKQNLKYDSWKETLGLDSSAYYQFLYPDSGKFEHTYFPENCIRQVAPFVVKQGAVQTVHYIYFNKVLQYYNQVNNPEPYSFQALDYPFDISMRLSDRLITIKNVKVPAGTKLILSVDADSLPANATSTKMEFKFTADEVMKLQPHFLWVNRSADRRFAYFQDGNTYRMLNFDARSTALVGPFFPGFIQYKNLNFNRNFDFRPNRLYTFQSDLIDRDFMNWQHWNFLQEKSARTTFQDEVLTERAILTKFKEFEVTQIFESRKPTEYYRKANSGFGSLSLRFKKHLQPIKAVFLLNLNNPDDYAIYPPSWYTFRNLTKGPHQVVIIYHDETYLKPKPLTVLQHGKTFYDLNADSVHAPDAFSRNVLQKLYQWSSQSSYGTLERDKEMDQIRQQFYQQSFNTNYEGRWITGVVTAEDGSQVPGVNVVVKGTTIGTATDAEGRYSLYVPPGGVLVFSFIGYSSQEVNSGFQTDVQLQPDVQQLSEVVVVGYGVSSKKSLLSASVSSVSYLQGRVAGVQVNGQTVRFDSLMIRVRGAASLGAPGSSPIVVVDGVVMSLDDVDPVLISRVEILKSVEATAIYGARASNGVMLISTKTGITRDELLKTKLPDVPMQIPDVALEGSSLRQRFSDYAFWQPQLRTDENGQVSFKATFPDDITAWKMNVIALAHQKRSVQRISSVRSFKPLLAQLSVPTFLIEDDSSLAIGKITNYSVDTLLLSQRISVNDKLISAGMVGVSNSKIDTIALVGTRDTLSVKYEIKRKGYLDGELRKIPILRKGITEAKGFFVSLPGDTTFTIDMRHAKGDIVLRAEADVLDVLLDEINQLKIYPYDCNEQMASKLYVLLAEKTICEFRQEKFQHDKQIEKAVRKLINNQNTDGGWGWWEKGKSSLWISRHVAGVLNGAEKAGYKVRYDRKGLINFLQNEFASVFPSGNSQEILSSLIFLVEQGEKVNSQGVVDSLRKQRKLTSQYDSLLAERLTQLTSGKPNWNWIHAAKEQTLRGNWYWGKRNYRLWNNDIANTLLVYQMMETENPKNPDLIKLRNYFLEQRSLSWRNTYESARIIGTIMPALLKKEYKGKPTLSIQGNQPEQITQFPYQKIFKNPQPFTVSKTGVEPVYFTAYYKEWNPAPEKVEKDFIVRTQWADEKINLEAGKQTKLNVTVTVGKDADYVMISVPIPAGCSYTSKPQSWSQGEVHREYDVHETRIYCERMKAGTYHYEIPLTPRYKGTYTLNPAKAEWMYFPVFFGRNSLSKTTIR